MATIPTLQNQVRTDAAPNFQQRPLENTVGESIGRGVGNLADVAVDAGQDLVRLVRGEQVKTDRVAFMDADRQNDSAANDIITKARTLQGKDAIGSTPQLLDEYDKAATKIAAGIPSRRATTAFTQSMNDRRAQLQRALDNHEGQQREAYYAKSREDFKDQAHINAVTNYQDPKAIEAEIDKVRGAVDQTPGLDEAQRATELGVRRSGIYTGVVQRYLANDQINAAQKYYDSIKQNVNGDKAAYIENAINDARRAAEARARARADHTDAIAGRTMNEIDRQIASGVPLTPAMWADAQNKVRGTSYEDAFKDRLGDEREVQDFLRKPIAEQQRYVQEKDAALKGGGNLREAANLDRLRNVFNKNIATINSAPLLYAESRLGQPTEPIDFGSLGSQDGVAALASNLNERAARIQGVERTAGTKVPMKPLLPQEAQQFSQMLEAASPKQAAELFRTLNQASGDPAVFRGMMQQVAPDSPVRALAGMISANADPLTTATHWFKPDESVTGRDVAATMLEGDRILNPSKTQKGEDGKPKSQQLLLTEAAQRDLQTQFAQATGDVFAGRPDAANFAYQAALAYYVGRESQKGTFSANSLTADTSTVREAVKATLGNVVDYNGNGSVLAPWGMAEDDFKTRVERAYNDKLAEMKVPASDAPGLDRVGLTNTNTDGQYAVTLGSNLLLDSVGHPVYLDLRPRGSK